MIFANKSPGGGSDGGERFMISSMKSDQHKKDILAARFKKQNTIANATANNAQQLQNLQN